MADRRLLLLPPLLCVCVCCDIFGYIKFFFPPGPRAFTSKRNRYTVCPPPGNTILLTSQANSLNLGQFSRILFDFRQFRLSVENSRVV